MEGVMSFFSSYKHSLFYKLLLSSLITGFLPFLLLFIYTVYLAERQMEKNIIQEQKIQANIIINNIDSYLSSLQKEIRFIAKLDIMNDIITDDLDKRIARLLIQKAQDVSADVKLYVLNKSDKIISSSEKQDLKQKLSIKKGNIYISSKIYSSFDPKKYLGTLMLEYKLSNLTHFFRNQTSIHNGVVDKFSHLIAGKPLPFTITIDLPNKQFIAQEHLIVYSKLKSPFDDFYFIYAVDKDVALSFLHHFLLFMLYILPVAIIVIIGIAIYNSKTIIKPIKELTQTADEITQTKDYSKKIHLTSKDEIGKLSLSFSQLLQTTNRALLDLELENSLRLQRFVKLIQIFNTIIKTTSEDECLNTSLQEIQQLREDITLSFSSLYDENAIPIYVTDFSTNKRLFFGSISLDISTFEDVNEEKFYHSIASMISLQLDRIRLINKTMSESNAKSAFISNMSHELRTPLNSILGYTQYLIAYEDINDAQQDIVSKIENSAEYLLEMINGILDIAKIEAGKMEVSISKVDIQTTIENILMMLEPLAGQKDIDLHVNFHGFEHISVESDIKLIQQIIINLLSNAIKFTQQGTIHISFSQENKLLFVHVKDSGIGIAKHDLEKLFQDFTQVQNVVQKKHKGTGLGLSLSKKLAKLIGGDVLLKSEGIGKGSEAILTLPL